MSKKTPKLLVCRSMLHFLI